MSTTLRARDGRCLDRTSRRRRTRPFDLTLRLRIIVAVLLLMLRVTVSAQDVTEPTLKAAFIYNFAIFTEWPAHVVAAAAPLVFCVIGDATVGDALARAIKGQVHDGHPMEVSGAGPPAACHILYVSGVTSAEAARLVAGLRDAPVLTMSDIKGFTEQGGIAQCFFEYGQLRFNVHLASITRARLQISSRLLALARIK